MANREMTLVSYSREPRADGRVLFCRYDYTRVRNLREGTQHWRRDSRRVFAVRPDVPTFEEDVGDCIEFLRKGSVPDLDAWADEHPDGVAA